MVVTPRVLGYWHDVGCPGPEVCRCETVYTIIDHRDWDLR